MPIPILFIGIAAATGAIGVGSTAKGVSDQVKAQNLNQNSDERLKAAKTRLEELRLQCGDALVNLGSEKLFVLTYSVHSFLDSFTKIKNVDFSGTADLMEIHHLHIDHKEFEELAELDSFGSSLLLGTATGAAGGAMTAFGAYSAAATFATASTGTAISTLSGAAASNATLAFFGGGSLASGGLGVAGGTAVLGGLVAGPALMVMGLITGAKAGKNLETARMNAAQATETCEQLETGAVQCIAIRRRTMMFYSMLARLDAIFLPLIYGMQTVIATEGTDYSQYSVQSKKLIASAASVAVSVKAILDTPLLSESGELTESSEVVSSNTAERIKQLEA